MQLENKNNKNKLANKNKIIKGKNYKRKKYVMSLYNRKGYLREPNYLPFTLRNATNFKIASRIVNEFEQQAKIEYLYGLLYPDRAYYASMGVKLPSTLPIPTNTFRFFQTTVLYPNNNGNLNLFWAPNYYITNHEAKELKELAQSSTETVLTDFDYATCASIYYNNDQSLRGDEPNDHFRPILQEYHDVEVSKYRLVSSLLRITYVGKAIDRAGTCVVCASYHDTTRLIFAGETKNVIKNFADNANVKNTSISKFADNSLISKGQWARIINSNKLKEGVECLYLPTDPLNAVFSNSGSIGNKSVLRKSDVDRIDTTFAVDNGKKAQFLFTPENANLQYAIGLSGLTPGAGIRVSEYRLYETIATEENAPLFAQNNNNVMMNKIYADNNVNQAVILDANKAIRPSTEGLSENKIKQSLGKQIIKEVGKAAKKPVVKELIRQGISKGISYLGSLL